ncbi:unnamed protein product [Amoebophrya sp. A120]|nr:unnamed protein product [Amoebophrya sp. A120]|eukprot:GSA120T00025070001.1
MEDQKSKTHDNKKSMKVVPQALLLLLFAATRGPQQATGSRPGLFQPLLHDGAHQNSGNFSPGPPPAVGQHQQQFVGAAAGTAAGLLVGNEVHTKNDHQQHFIQRRSAVARRKTPAVTSRYISGETTTSTMDSFCFLAGGSVAAMRDEESTVSDDEDRSLEVGGLEEPHAPAGSLGSRVSPSQEVLPDHFLLHVAAAQGRHDDCEDFHLHGGLKAGAGYACCNATMTTGPAELANCRATTLRTDEMATSPRQARQNPQQLPAGLALAALVRRGSSDLELVAPRPVGQNFFAPPQEEEAQEPQDDLFQMDLEDQQEELMCLPVVSSRSEDAAHMEQMILTPVVKIKTPDDHDRTQQLPSSSSTSGAGPAPAGRTTSGRNFQRLPREGFLNSSTFMRREQERELHGEQSGSFFDRDEAATPPPAPVLSSPHVGASTTGSSGAASRSPHLRAAGFGGGRRGADYSFSLQKSCGGASTSSSCPSMLMANRLPRGCSTSGEGDQSSCRLVEQEDLHRLLPRRHSHDHHEDLDHPQMLPETPQMSPLAVVVPRRKSLVDSSREGVVVLAGDDHSTSGAAGSSAADLNLQRMVLQDARNKFYTVDPGAKTDLEDDSGDGDDDSSSTEDEWSVSAEDAGPSSSQHRMNSTTSPPTGPHPPGDHPMLSPPWAGVVEDFGAHTELLRKISSAGSSSHQDQFGSANAAAWSRKDWGICQHGPGSSAAESREATPGSGYDHRHAYRMPEDHRVAKAARKNKSGRFLTSPAMTYADGECEWDEMTRTRSKKRPRGARGGTGYATMHLRVYSEPANMSTLGQRFYRNSSSGSFMSTMSGGVSRQFTGTSTASSAQVLRVASASRMGGVAVSQDSFLSNGERIQAGAGQFLPSAFPPSEAPSRLEEMMYELGATQGGEKAGTRGAFLRRDQPALGASPSGAAGGLLEADMDIPPFELQPDRRQADAASDSLMDDEGRSTMGAEGDQPETKRLRNEECGDCGASPESDQCLHDIEECPRRLFLGSPVSRGRPTMMGPRCGTSSGGSCISSPELLAAPGSSSSRPPAGRGGGPQSSHNTAPPPCQLLPPVPSDEPDLSGMLCDPFDSDGYEISESDI